MSDAGRRAIQAGLRSRGAFTLRRAQILLSGAEGQRPSRIAAHAGCAAGTAHNALHAFEEEGTGCPTGKKRGPKDARPILGEAKADPLKGILHQSPRRFGEARSARTLDLLADVAFELELTPRRLSHEAVRQAVERLGRGWKRAETWITSPGPAYARKKSPWIRSHNREAKAKGGIRVVACFRPVKSPWPNPVEPKWAHGERAIVEPERLLAANEVRTRVCDYYGCEHLEPLAQRSA